MCKTISIVTYAPKGLIYFIDAETRTKLYEKSNEIEFDSHTFILTHFGISPNKQENWNCYEYNIFLKKPTLTKDEIVDDSDYDSVLAFCQSYDWMPIVKTGLLNVDCGEIEDASELNLELLNTLVTINYAYFSSLVSAPKNFLPKLETMDYADFSSLVKKDKDILKKRFKNIY